MYPSTRVTASEIQTCGSIQKDQSNITSKEKEKKTEKS
jgi:hypothetical protein